MHLHGSMAIHHDTGDQPDTFQSMHGCVTYKAPKVPGDGVRAVRRRDGKRDDTILWYQPREIGHSQPPMRDMFQYLGTQDQIHEPCRYMEHVGTQVALDKALIIRVCIRTTTGSSRGGSGYKDSILIDCMLIIVLVGANAVEFFEYLLLFDT